MKKILNGRLYNTETATKLAEWTSGHGQNDLNYCEETLYRKKTGEYFIHGIGGPMSGWARPCPTGGFSDGEGVRPLNNEDEAREWAEPRLDADNYIGIFGEVSE